jgi:biopolymer transport protein ExbD
MPKIKKRRLAIRIDMTPMVDVAMLLLTFFMMTTQFKPPQAVDITLPSSDKGPKLPESGVLTISIDKAGQIFMGVDQQQIMRALFEPMYPNGIQDKDGKIVPVWLVPAVPIQQKDLANLVVQARIQNIRLITVIKADKDADYGPIMDVMNDLQKAQVSRFNLQTELRSGGGGKEG